MKKRYSEEQIIQILREAESSGNALEVIRKYGISNQSFYRWKRKFEGMDVSDARRLRQLESENVKLKKIVADQALAIQNFQEFLKKRGLM